MPASQGSRTVLGGSTSAVKLHMLAVAVLFWPQGALASQVPTGGKIATAETFEALASRCAPAVHPSTLAAVVKTESGANPFAIGVNTKGVRLKRQPRSLQEAVQTARWLLVKGYNFDVGLGQINSKNFDWLDLSIEAAFEPCANLSAAATVLKECYARATRSPVAGRRPLHSALSCYNTGSLTRGFANGYVARVSGNAGYDVPPIVATPSEQPAVVGTAPDSDVAEKPRDPNERVDAFASQGKDAFAPKPDARSEYASQRMSQGAEIAEPIRLTGVRK